MHDSRKIKQLKSQLNQLVSDAEILKVEIANKQREYSSKTQSVREIENMISALKSTNDIKVSEHAMLRYLERVKGINMTEVENEIVTDSMRSTVKILGGDGKYSNGSFQVIMKDHTVITIV